MQILENSASLSREELVERTEAAVAAFGRERRRNAELVHRLQQLHGEQVRILAPQLHVASWTLDNEDCGTRLYIIEVVASWILYSGRAKQFFRNSTTLYY